MALVCAGCAGGSAFRSGKKEARKGNWDLAVARLTLALNEDPGNIEYKLALQSARVEASQMHYKEARKQLAGENLDKGAEELEIACKFDPSNKSAADDLKLTREKIQKREEEKQGRSELEMMKARAQAARVPTAVLSPRSPVPITLKFASQPLEKILDSLGKLAGVNIVYDADFHTKMWSLDVSNVTFQEALDQITMVNRLFYKVLDQNTVIIVPETQQKRHSYDDLLVRTFYLENADVNETLTIIKTVAGITKAVGNPTLGAITLVGTADRIALAAKIVEANDKAKGEVIVEVQIIEVNRTAIKQYGLQLSNYSAQATFAPTGAAGELANGYTNVRANVLSSLNVADFVLSVPSTVTANFLQSDSGVKILASPRLRAAEGKKTELKIGTEVPIPITQFTATSAGTSTFAPATSFQYRNVGITLGLTPKVNATGDVTLDMSAEFSSLGDDRNVGTGQNPITVPTFLTRNVTGILRVKDGETTLLGGLIQGRDADSLKGVLGIQSIPIINKLFTSRQKQKDESEVLISITPHVVRAPKLREQDFAPLYIGTDEAVRVASAHALFGEPDAPAPSSSSVPVAGSAVALSPAKPAAASPPPPAPAPAAAPTSTPPSPTPPPSASAAAVDASRIRAICSPPEVRLKVGEQGSLAIVGLGTAGLTAAEVSVSYDAALLEASEVSPGSLLTLDGVSVQAERKIESGRLHAKFSRATPATGSGALFTIQFKSVSAGSGALTVESLALTTSAGEEHPASPACRVEVAP
ncbi:MAG: cohesin domain-containing protein [Vicinamibacteria bacterium]